MRGFVYFVGLFVREGGREGFVWGCIRKWWLGVVLLMLAGFRMIGEEDRGGMFGEGEDGWSDWWNDDRRMLHRL